MSDSGTATNIMASEAAPACAVCGHPMERERRSWQYRCRGCGFRFAALTATIGDADASAIDEGFREDALEPLRRANFERLLDVTRRWQEPRGRTLLDVGCAHGWFLNAASRRGYAAMGIEPDARMVAVARKAGQNVVKGYFPSALEPGTTFDAITFNDVFEHLPDVNAALDACRARLREGGLLVMNLPNSRGSLFRAATILDRLGLHGPLDRLWQRGFPSPHLSYFTPECLSALADRHGFRELYRGELATLERAGLWQRLRYDRTASMAASVATWCAVTGALPVLRLLTSDISLQVFQKCEVPAV